MNHWIIALPRKDMEHCIKIGTFGLGRKFILGHVQKGDKVACYVTKEYKIIALGETTTDYYVDDSSVFEKEGLFPDRFDFKAEKLASDAELDFMTVIDKMSFVKNLAYWSAYFRNGIVRIQAADWNTLIAKTKQLTKD